MALDRTSAHPRRETAAPAATVPAMGGSGVLRGEPWQTRVEDSRLGPSAPAPGVLWS